MLWTIFVICATIGGTILVCQVIMTVVGWGGHPGDMDFSGDMAHGFGGDFHGDTGAGFHGDAGGAFHGHGGTDLHAHSGAHAAQGEHGHVDHGASSWLFRAISFRTVVAALTFFGLAGLAAKSAGASTPTVFLVALAAGAAAMYGVYWMMLSLYRLRAEGTVRIEGAVGRSASVYLKIPGHESGTGKIQINLQNRTMEYLAVTCGDELPTGAKVIVVDVITPNTVVVEPVSEPERVEHV